MATPAPGVPQGTTPAGPGYHFDVNGNLVWDGPTSTTQPVGSPVTGPAVNPPDTTPTPTVPTKNDTVTPPTASPVLHWTGAKDIPAMIAAATAARGGAMSNPDPAYWNSVSGPDLDYTYQQMLGKGASGADAAPAGPYSAAAGYSYTPSKPSAASSLSPGTTDAFKGFLGNSLVPTSPDAYQGLLSQLQSILGTSGNGLSAFYNPINGGGGAAAGASSGGVPPLLSPAQSVTNAVGAATKTPTTIAPPAQPPVIPAPTAAAPSAGGTIDPNAPAPAAGDGSGKSGPAGNTYNSAEGYRNPVADQSANYNATAVPDRVGTGIASLFGLSPVMAAGNMMQRYNNPVDNAFAPMGPTDPNLKGTTPEEQQRNSQILADLLAHNEANGGR